MELTWIAVLASLAMGLAAVCIFIFAVKKDYFRNLEDAKYQVFWSDVEDSGTGLPACLDKPEACPTKENPNAGGSPKSP